jgi:hypothetical protein
VSDLTVDDFLSMFETNLGMEFEMKNNETEEVKFFANFTVKGGKQILRHDYFGSIFGYVDQEKECFEGFWRCSSLNLK